MGAYEEKIVTGDEEEKDLIPNALFYKGMPEEENLRMLNDLAGKLKNFNRELTKKDTRSDTDYLRNRNSINPGHQHLLIHTTPTQITANQNDYDINADNFLRISTDASRTITGFNGGVKGRFLYVVNFGSFNLVLADQSASSVAANRIITSSGDNLTLNADEAVMLWYDSTTARWRQMGIVISIDDISDVVITSAAQGQILYHNGTNWVNLAVGTSGQFLQTLGAAANPAWATVGRVSAIKLDWANANLAGNQVETTLKTYTLPGGTLGTNDGLRATFNYTGATDSTLRFYWGGTAYMVDTAVVTSPTSRGTVEIWNTNSVSAQRITGFSVGLGSSPAFIGSSGVDAGPSINTAADVIIKITGETSAGGAMDLLGWTIEHIRA